MKTNSSGSRFDKRGILILAIFMMIFLLGACDKTELPGEPIVQTLEESKGTLEGRDPAGGGFFPLQIGNRWTYAGEISVVYENFPPSLIHTFEERALIGTEEWFEREYVLEEQVVTDDTGPARRMYWSRYRQDHTGLYEADIAATEPPLHTPGGVQDMLSGSDYRRDRMVSLWESISKTIPVEHQDAYRHGFDVLLLRLKALDAGLGRWIPRAPVLTDPAGGVLPGEITRLQYPLHPGQEWTVRDEPLFTSVVEGHDVLDLGGRRMNGWRIRVLNPSLGPNDVILLWFGRQGFLRKAIHMETEITDPAGNPIDTAILDESLSLESLVVVWKGLF